MQKMKNKIVILLLLLFATFGSCEKTECLDCKDTYYFVWDWYPVKHFVYDTTYVRCPSEEGHFVVPVYGYDIKLPTDYVQDEIPALRDTTFLDGHFIRHRYCNYQ